MYVSTDKYRMNIGRVVEEDGKEGGIRVLEGRGDQEKGRREEEKTGRGE